MEVAHMATTLIYQNGVRVRNGYVEIDNKPLPRCPAKNYSHVTVINKHVYIGGYEFKNGKWKRTLKALWYNLF